MGIKINCPIKAFNMRNDFGASSTSFVSVLSPLHAVMNSVGGTVLVIGGTGKVGQHIVKSLRARDIPVRVLVRNLDSVSVEQETEGFAAATDVFADKVGRAPLLVSDSRISGFCSGCCWDGPVGTEEM